MSTLQAEIDEMRRELAEARGGLDRAQAYAMELIRQNEALTRQVTALRAAIDAARQS